MFIHFSMILIIFKKHKIKFSQKSYDSLFFCIENNLRELGFGDVAVNKKMKDLNKIFYDILLKINISKINFKINEKLIFSYFGGLTPLNHKKYTYLELYFTDFYNFCFEKDPKIMIKEAINFKVK